MQAGVLITVSGKQFMQTYKSSASYDTSLLQASTGPVLGLERSSMETEFTPLIAL